MRSLNTLIKTSLCAAALATLSLSAQAAAVPGQGTWEATLQARDINGDSVVDAYYDTDLDITWLADWNVNRRMDWDTAIAWAGGLDVYGTTGWRLPSTVDGLASFGEKPPVDSSEMAHMFYVTLGNEGFPDAGFGLSNTANFLNMKNFIYWSGTELGDNPLAAWALELNVGFQNGYPKDDPLYAVAVRPGDVVPEPETWALMLAGLTGLLLVRRRPR